MYQVSIEVVEDSQTEVEMDLAKENQRNDWSEWASSHRKLFWPLFWEYPDQLENRRDSSEEYSYDLEEPVMSGLDGNLGGHWNKDWDSNYGKKG